MPKTARRAKPGVGVDLLQHLVDVDGIGLIALGFALLAILGNSLFGLGSISNHTASQITFSRKTHHKSNLPWMLSRKTF